MNKYRAKCNKSPDPVEASNCVKMGEGTYKYCVGKCPAKSTRRGFIPDNCHSRSRELRRVSSCESHLQSGKDTSWLSVKPLLSGIDNCNTRMYHTGMKVAISIPEEILNEVEGLTKEFGCSRSRVFAMAVEELLERRRARGLLQALNEAYEDDSPEEAELKRRSKDYHARKVRKEPC